MGYRTALSSIRAATVAALLALGAPSLASPTVRADEASDLRLALEPSRRVLLDVDFAGGETGMFEIHFGAHAVFGIQVALEQEGGHDITVLHMGAGLTWIENRMGTFDAASSCLGFTVGTLIGATLERRL